MGMPKSAIEDDARYQVFCGICDEVFEPVKGSSLWWQAKKRCEQGYLDALCVKNCGCEEEEVQPDAPYRVFGYTAYCEDFDFPCETFTSAVSLYRRLQQDSWNTSVCITGVGDAVKQVLYSQY